MAGNGEPRTPSQQAAQGPAGGIIHAGQYIENARPEDHDQMRELMFAFDAAFGILAAGIEAFQQAQVARGFHPYTMAPLDIVVNNLGESRWGFTRVLVAIERIYAVNFEAAQNQGPGESFFGAQRPRSA